jgi:ribosomal protein S3AE
MMMIKKILKPNSKMLKREVETNKKNLNGKMYMSHKKCKFRNHFIYKKEDPTITMCLQEEKQII